MDNIDALLTAQAASGQTATGPVRLSLSGMAPNAPSTAGMDDIDKLLSAQASSAQAPGPNPDPLDGMSMLDKLRAGAGMGMSKIARNAGQAVGLVSQSDIDEANRLDQPLAGTTPGKIGSFVGQTAAVLPAVLVPGASVADATAIGAGVGGLTTAGGLGDRATGALFGAAGGALGKVLGDAAGAGFGYLANRRAAAQVANAGRDTAATAAKDAGYVLPPADVNPTMINEVLNGLSGKIKTAQSASTTNQLVTNNLARSGVGAPMDQPLSVNGLNAIRQQAGQAYDAVSNAGTIHPGQAYTDALDAITAPYVKAAQGFPDATPSPIIGAINALKSPEFDAGSAVSMIKSLRSAADTAYAAGNKESGASLKSGASALEDAIDAHLTETGASPNLLNNFRDARQLIAKTYSVQKGLNNTTGDVAAKALAGQLAKGKPLSGDLLTIAQTASAFPKATQALTEAPKQLSPLDFMGGLLAASASGHPAVALGVLARPAVRVGLLSRPYQSLMTTPSYQAGPLQGLLGDAMTSDAFQQWAPALGGLLTSRFANQ